MTLRYYHMRSQQDVDRTFSYCTKWNGHSVAIKITLFFIARFKEGSFILIQEKNFNDSSAILSIQWDPSAAYNAYGANVDKNTV